MRRPQGHAQVLGPGLEGLSDPGLVSLQKWGEADTFTCGHCQRVVHVPVRGGHLGTVCRVCMKMVCPVCEARRECFPFEEALERALREAENMRWLRS